MKTRWIAVPGALLAAVAASALLARHSQGGEVAVVTSGELVDRIVARAAVVPRDGIAEVRPRVDGRVLRVDVREGELVKPGQVLAEIEAEMLSDEVTRRRAEQTALAANAESVVHGLRPEEQRALEAEQRAAREELAIAQDRAKRTLSLVGSGAFPEASNEETAHALEIAKARVEVAESRLRLGRAGGRMEDVRGAEARVAAASAALRQAERQLDKARIIAPTGGVLLARRVDPGDTINVADGAMLPAIFEIADATKLEARLEVEEPDSMRVASGLAVTFKLPSGAVVGKGTITRVGARCDRRTLGGDPAMVRADGLVRTAWATLEGDAAMLPIGQRLDAFVALPPRRVAALVPRGAVHVRDGVARLELPGFPWRREREISVGVADESFVEVMGVAPGERIFVR